MQKQAIILFTLFVVFSSCKKFKETAQAQAEATVTATAQQVAVSLDSPDTLYNLLNDFRRTNANIYKGLFTGSMAAGLYGMAQQEVDYMIQNSKFGQFENFNQNSAKFTSYTEVVCSLAEYHDGKAYQAAYDIWMQDESIVKEIKNEYTLADANCEGYGNGWMCTLMLATP